MTLPGFIKTSHRPTLSELPKWPLFIFQELFAFPVCLDSPSNLVQVKMVVKWLYARSCSKSLKLWDWGWGKRGAGTLYISRHSEAAPVLQKRRLHTLSPSFSLSRGMAPQTVRGRGGVLKERCIEELWRPPASRLLHNRRKQKKWAWPTSVNGERPLNVKNKEAQMSPAKVQFGANCSSTPNHVIGSLQLVKDKDPTKLFVP